MNPSGLELHLRLIGVLLLWIAALGVYVHRRFGWGAEIARLELLTRQVFVVHSVFVSGTLVLLGVLLVACAPALLTPGPLPRALLAGLLVMWSARLAAQWFYYDSRLWRGNRLHTVVHVLFSVIYSYFVLTFALALAAHWRGL